QQSCSDAGNGQVPVGQRAYWRVHLIPGRGQVDYLLIDGLPRVAGSLSGAQAWDAASKSLIADIDLAADEAVARTHLDEFRHFCRQMLEACHSRTDQKFDQWLKVESGQGFLRALPKYRKLRGQERVAAKERAKRYFRLLLWSAYQSASRCFGAMMLV